MTARFENVKETLLVSYDTNHMTLYDTKRLVSGVSHYMRVSIDTHV